jgi:hypothetical protein
MTLEDVRAFAQKMSKMGKQKQINIIKQEFKDKPIHLTNKILSQILEEETPKLAPVSKQKYTTKFFNNFRGGWTFDIMYGRNRDAVDDDLYAVFVNNNSKYVWACEIKNRSQPELNSITQDFTIWAEKNKIPIRGGITADKEKALQSLQQYTTHTAKLEHHKFGVVDGFIQAARYWNENNGFGKGITWERLKNFIDQVWNKSKVNFMNCTREEMLYSEDLEETYICKNIYYNLNKLENRKDIKEGQEVEVRKEGKSSFEHRHTRHQPGKWKVVSTEQNRAVVKNEKGEEKRIYYGQIRRKEPTTIPLDKNTLSQPLPEKELSLEEIYQEQPPPNMNRQLEIYNQNYDNLQEKIVNKVEQDMGQLREYELSVGFKPETRLFELNKMSEENKKNIEQALRKYIVGTEAYQHVFTPQQTEMLGEIFLNFLRNNPFQVQKTNATSNELLKGAELLLKKKKKKADFSINPQFDLRKVPE